MTETDKLKERVRMSGRNVKAGQRGREREQINNISIAKTGKGSPPCLQVVWPKQKPEQQEKQPQGLEYQPGWERRITGGQIGVPSA